MKAPFCFAVAAMLFASCSNDETLAVPESDTPVNPYKVTPEEAQIAVLDFLEVFDQSGQTRSATPRSICNVKALRKSAAATRAALGENALDLDTLMYVVNFSDSAGYALVAADKRTTPIFAIIEQGNYDFEKLVEEENEGAMIFLEQAIDRTQMDIEKYDEAKESSPTRAATLKGWYLSERVLPILETKWGQGNTTAGLSYGKYCSNKVAGCVPVAMAQIMSHYQTVKEVRWVDERKGVHTSTLNWSRIMNDNQEYNGSLSPRYTPASMDEVAHLCRFLGYVIGANYKNDGKTYANTEDAVKWLNKHGGLRATDLEYYNENKILNALKKGEPVLARGYSHKTKAWIKKRRYKNGHAWVYDGYVTAEKNGQKYNMVHCNWGWNGNWNGYYIAHIFDTNVGPEVHDFEATRAKGTDNYYCFRLQFSTLSKR